MASATPTAPIAAPAVAPPPVVPQPAAAAPIVPAPPAAVAEPVTTRPTNRTEAMRDPDPPSRKGRPAAITRPAARAAEPPPPPSKQDRPTRVAMATTDSATHAPDAGVAEEPHRPAAPPPPPAPVQTSTPTAVAAAVPPPTPQTAPVAPTVVAPTALDANRIAGDKSIAPDEATMDAITRAGADKVISSYKVCITAEGAINTVSLLKSSGFPAYDEKIQATIRRDWRYRPYLVNGKATPVCTGFRFIYSQK
jgi:hypothetical protein